MNKTYYLYITYLLFWCSGGLWAQAPIGEEKPTVQVIGTATKTAIKLRWAVTTPLAWNYAKDYGFTIERTTITRAGVILETPEVKILTPTPILPKPMMEWEAFTQRNDNAAIAAQALYGSEFNVDMEQGGDDIVSIMNQATALEQRFSFALFAADQDYEVATFSGLAYVDTQVQPNEQYLYRVYAAIPKEKIEVAFGGIYIGLADHKPLPKPLELVGIFKDQQAMLSWNYTLLKKYYTNYTVERSSDNGQSFTALDAVPVTNLSEREKNPSDRMFYMDSLPQNNTTYNYRIKGITPFGQVGPPSKTVKGSGKKVLYANPAITEAALQSDNASAVIQWEFPEEALASLAYFELNQSETVKNNYKVVVSNINKNTRTLTYTNLNTVNYFTITAVGVDGTKRVSFPQMVQPVDGTPPAVPIALTGTIDSTGVVQLQWQKNTEADFMGYRVFRAYLENEEFTQITFRTVPEPQYVDTIVIKTLNPKVYYKVQAFDKRYNPSAFSEVLTLVKPDVIPPTQAVFTSFTADKDTIALQWEASSSIDATHTLVYRKEKGATTPWALQTTLPIETHTYTDKTITPNIPYLYTLVTVDTSGLQSAPAVPLTITLPDNAPKPEIDTFTASVNREEEKISLRWNYKALEVIEYKLYKGDGEHPPTLYKVFEPQEKRFTDQQLKINSTYTYRLQAVFTSGATSPTKTIEVTY